MCSLCKHVMCVIFYSVWNEVVFVNHSESLCGLLFECTMALQHFVHAYDV